MNLFHTFGFAWKSILSNKLRSFLTMLGIIIGVASVILLVGLVNGVTDYIISSFADMGTNMISVTVTNTGTRTASDDTMYLLAEENGELFEGVSPLVTGSFTLKNGTVSLNRKTVSGVGETYAAINHNTLSEGRFLSYGDIITRNRVCVIGTYLLNELFADSVEAVGQTLKINGDVYKVVGVLEEQEDSTENSADDCIYIPYTNAARLNWSANASTYVFAAQSTDGIAYAEEVLDTALYDIYKDEALYTIRSMTALLDTVNSMTGLLAAVLSGIAGISLLVAGIGIMNIMLVSVVERTREIGIRKALGAKQGSILLQFIIEAATISSLGGLIGIIVGCSGIYGLGNTFGLNASPSPGSILISFGVSAAIGIFFGFAPARRAAKLHPIEALGKL